MKIGAAARATGISQRMIRHYEAVGLTRPPLRRDSNYRDYSERDLHELGFIARARNLGFSLVEIGQLLSLWRDSSRESAQVKRLALARIAELKAKEQALREMRRTLESLAASCQGDERPNCPIIAGLAKD